MNENWIESSKELPEMNRWCFFWYGGIKPMLGCYKDNGAFLCIEDNEFWTIDEDNVTHWMYAPTAPVSQK